jgi:hypothetical protein
MNLAGELVGAAIWEGISSAGMPEALAWLLLLVYLISGYLLVVMLILFLISTRKSLFYAKPAGGLLTALFAVGVLFIINLSQFLLIPFGAVTRFGVSFIISLGRSGMFAHSMLLLIIAAVLFVITSKLLERKVNI